jgi:short-subunit dehydrogenase
MSEIKNKTVLVTGGAAGIGRQIGELCLQQGAGRLIIWDIDRKKLEETFDSLVTGNVEIHVYPVDVSRLDEIMTAAADIRRKWGGIDILFNNAGIVPGNKLFYEHSHHDIDKTMRINADAPMHVALEFLPGMIEKKSGHIINISSAAGMIANPRLSVYCASKHAVIGWGESLRIELEKISPNLHVTTVTPTFISTGMFAGVRSPLIPLIRPEAAARRIMRGVRKNKIFVRLPWIVYSVPFFKGILPQRIMDFLAGKIFGFHRSMDTFKGKTE